MKWETLDSERRHESLRPFDLPLLLSKIPVASPHLNGPKFSQSHAVFGQNLQNRMLASPPGGLGPPPTGNPGSAPWLLCKWLAHLCRQQTLARFVQCLAVSTTKSVQCLLQPFSLCASLVFIYKKVRKNSEYHWSLWGTSAADNEYTPRCVVEMEAVKRIELYHYGITMVSVCTHIGHSF